MVPKTNNDYCGLCNAEESQCMCAPGHFTPGSMTNPSPSSDLGINKDQNPIPTWHPRIIPPQDTELGPDGKPWDDTVDFEKPNEDPETPDSSSSKNNHPPEKTIHEVVDSPVVTNPPVENENTSPTHVVRPPQ
ncbi:hypothetical protein GEMRC1_003018 [Eukaryota sp. GEM-RC1]